MEEWFMKMTSLLIVVCALIFGAASDSGQQRGPSTPEERARAVEMTNYLETTPLAKDAKDYRAKLLLFLTEVPDITVSLCTNVLGETKRVKGDYDSELVGQLAFSQAKFIIEHPDKAQDKAAVYLATVGGVLRTWQAIKTAKPKAKFPLMDELLQKQQAGTLAEYVNSAMTGCK
jgi:hypothetical protein